MVNICCEDKDFEKAHILLDDIRANLVNSKGYFEDTNAVNKDNELIDVVLNKIVEVNKKKLGIK